MTDTLIPDLIVKPGGNLFMPYPNGEPVIIVPAEMEQAARDVLKAIVDEKLSVSPERIASMIVVRYVRSTSVDIWTP